MRRRLRVLGVLAAFLVAGALVGLAGAVATPAHLEIAGARAEIRLQPGNAYDLLRLSGVLTAKRATGRALLGEPVGVGVSFDLDPSAFVTTDGSFDTNILPAYIQTFSDPEQLAHDIQWALIRHVLLWCSVCAGLGVVLGATLFAYRNRRRARDAVLDGRERALVRAYWRHERAFARRAALAAAVLVALASVPGAAVAERPPEPITASPLLEGTPLAGTEIGGLLAPALSAVDNYVRTYFSDTTEYYDEVRTKLLAQLDAEPITLPEGDVANLLFVTDRHCNIGMDRVIVALAGRLGITVLVSAGDDAFSGSFDFESACTANLAAKSQGAGMTDVFVGGNHDSPMTLADEKNQKIHVLDSSSYQADGLTFVGIPDPRTSRYGQGIAPADPLVRHRLVEKQARATGALACAADGPVVVVLHDPGAGATALENSCGKALFALDGHTHKIDGPTPIALSDGSTAYRFTGGSAGGAPTESQVEASLTSRLTVGPLRHDASFAVVSVDRSTGLPVQVVECRISPSQDITFDVRTP